MSISQTDFDAMKARAERGKLISRCPECAGRGWYMMNSDPDRHRCDACNGTGKRFGRGVEDITSPLETVGRAKAEAAPLDSPAILEEPSIRSESDQHKQFQQWCNLNEIETIHCPMDRKHFIGNGSPDFFCLKMGRVTWIEFKFGNNDCSGDQFCFQRRLKDRGIPGLVCWSVAAAIAFTTEELLTTKEDK